MSKGWHSGESARLPSMWPRFKSRRRHHMWIKFVVGSFLCSERFFSGTPVFPSPPKPTFPNSNSIRNQVDKEPLCGCTCATSKSLSLLLIIISLQKDAGQVALDEEERLRMLLEVCASLLFRNRSWQVKNSLEPW